MQSLALLAALVLGQECAPKAAPTQITVEVRDRTVKEPVTGLTPTDLTLSGRGVSPTPLGLVSGLPADIVILIEDRGRGGLLAGAASLFVKSLLPQDRVAIVTYGVSTKTQLNWSQDPEAIRLAIEKGADGMHLQVARPLYGVVDSLKVFDKPVPGRQRAIFLFGDDEDNGSNIRVEQLAANLIKQRVTLDLAIDPAPSRRIPRVNVPPPTVGNETPAMRYPRVGQQSVSLLAEATGGQADKYLQAEFFAAMRERLARRFTLTYCVENKHASRAPRIELSDSGQRNFPNAEVLAPNQ